MTITKEVEDKIPALMHIIQQMLIEHPFLCKVLLNTGMKQCLWLSYCTQNDCWFHEEDRSEETKWTTVWELLWLPRKYTAGALNPNLAIKEIFLQEVIPALSCKRPTQVSQVKNGKVRWEKQVIWFSKKKVLWFWRNSRSSSVWLECGSVVSNLLKIRVTWGALKTTQWPGCTPYLLRQDSLGMSRRHQ